MTKAEATALKIGDKVKHKVLLDEWTVVHTGPIPILRREWTLTDPDHWSRVEPVEDDFPKYPEFLRDRGKGE